MDVFKINDRWYRIDRGNDNSGIKRVILLRLRAFSHYYVEFKETRFHGTLHFEVVKARRASRRYHLSLEDLFANIGESNRAITDVLSEEQAIDIIRTVHSQHADFLLERSVEIDTRYPQIVVNDIYR